MGQSRSTQAARRQATRARLLDAAFTVFAAQGYTGATVDSIVQSAGYSKGAFYFHFSSKEEVFLEVLWSRARTEEQSLRTASQTASGRPLELLRGVAVFLSPGGDDALWPALLLEFWSHAARNPRVREGVASVAKFRREALLAALHAAADAGVMRPTMPFEDCTDLLLTLGDGFIARAGAGQDESDPGYLPGLIASMLGVQIGPRVLAKEREAQPAKRTGTE